MGNKPHRRPSTVNKKKKVQRPQVSAEAAQMQMQLVTMRSMYDQATQEKAVLEAQVQQSKSLIASLLVQLDIEKVIVREKAIDVVASGVVAGLGIDPSKSPKGVKLELYWAEEAPEEADDAPAEEG